MLGSDVVGKQLPHRDKLVSTSSPAILQNAHNKWFRYVLGGWTIATLRVGLRLALLFAAKSLRLERTPHL